MISLQGCSREAQGNSPQNLEFQAKTYHLGSVVGCLQPILLIFGMFPPRVLSGGPDQIQLQSGNLTRKLLISEVPQHEFEAQTPRLGVFSLPRANL